MNRKPLIISTDPGIDDAAAITISLFAKELDVKAVVATWGNVSLERTLENSLKLETFLHTNVPVIKGANRPLLRKAISAASVHGESGMAGYDFDKPDMNLLKPGLAATHIHEIISSSNEKVILMGIGPLTDFALFINQYPEDLVNVEKFVLMGGNIDRGNFTAFSEYNFAGDPEAAQIVFQSGVPIEVAPLELGHIAQVTPNQMLEIKQYGEVGEMLYSLFTNIHEDTEGEGTEIYDATAVGMLLAPEIYTFKPATVEIELDGRYTYGASVMDFKGYLEKPQNARIAVNVDTKKFAKWFVEAIKNANQGRK